MADARVVISWTVNADGDWPVAFSLSKTNIPNPCCACGSRFPDHFQASDETVVGAEVFQRRSARR